MEQFKAEDVEKVVFDVLQTVTEMAPGSITMDMPLADIGLKSLQVISISALIEEKLGYGPNYRALIGMEKVSDIRDFILR